MDNIVKLVYVIKAKPSICDQCQGRKIEDHDDKIHVWVIVIGNRGAVHLCSRCRMEVLHELSHPA